MSSKEALDKIIRDLKENRFEISSHALERMAQRSLVVIDIIALIEGEGPKNPEWNEKHGSWNFTGKGFAGELFTIACVYENGTLIVTVFWR